MKRWLSSAIALVQCIHRIRPHLQGGRHLLMAVLGASMVMTAFEGVGVGLLVPLLSLLLGGENATPMRPIQWLQGWIPDRSPAFYVALLAGAIIAAIALKNAASIGSQFLAARLKRRMNVNLRMALFQRLQSAELSVFEQRSAGEMANLFLMETHRATNALEILIIVGQRLSIASFYVVALFFISWPLTLVALTVGAALVAAVSTIYRTLGRLSGEITEGNRTISTQLMQSFAGIRVVRATNSQLREINRFRKANDFQARAEEKATRTTALLAPVSETLAVMGGMAIILCAYVFFVRKGIMLSSHLFGFGFILLRTIPLINQIYGLCGHFLHLAGGAHEVEKWLALAQHPARTFGKVPFDKVHDSLKFEDVSFSYPTGTRALSNISFALPAGKTVALVGASGSGKSTVANLLLRFRPPTTGRITVDGRDYWDFSAESWHERVSVVEQESFLFHDTLAANIGYGFPAVSEERILEAVRLAHLGDVVGRLPHGINTVVGERGVLLSGGQRQRLSIARALVRDPSVLILDEATSSLDGISERQVQLALEEAVLGRTVLVIAHRLTTIRNADWIVVLQGGRVVQQGTWESLQNMSGEFRDLLRSNAYHPSVLNPATALPNG